MSYNSLLLRVDQDIPSNGRGTSTSLAEHKCSKNTKKKGGNPSSDLASCLCISQRFYSSLSQVMIEILNSSIFRLFNVDIASRSVFTGQMAPDGIVRQPDCEPGTQAHLPLPSYNQHMYISFLKSLLIRGTEAEGWHHRIRLSMPTPLLKPRVAFAYQISDLPSQSLSASFIVFDNLSDISCLGRLWFSTDKRCA
jgi:hypothetical protein